MMMRSIDCSCQAEGVVEGERMEAVDLLCSRNAQPGRPSPGLMACLGVPVGGWVRRLRAVEDQAGHPVECRRKSSLWDKWMK
jgi:hypothetical protein